MISYSRWSPICTILDESNGEDSGPALSSFTLWCFPFILEEEERWWHWRFFCLFVCLFVLWFTSWETPRYFERNVVYFNIVRALICHYILLEKKKEAQLVIWKTYFESISQTLQTYESLMCSNFYKKLTLCVKEHFFFFLLKPWQNFGSGYKLKKY